MSQPVSTNVSRGLAWLGVANGLVGVLDIVAMLLILNFWITPEELGIATKCVWIFPILDQATDLGLSAAIIQRDDHTDERISTVFWINVMLCVSMFGVLCIGAPFLAREVYHAEIVGWMLIAYGLKLILQNGYTFPFAMLKRQLRFKELSMFRVIANTAEFLGKVGFAWAGFGIWCFVLGPLARTVVYIVCAQVAAPYRPRWMFNLREARDYVTFGLRSSASQILYYFYTNIDYPIVGFLFGNTALGLYRAAYEIVLEPVRIISNVVVDAAFPAFARLRHSKDAVMKQFISFTRLNVITVMLYASLIFVAAPELIATLFPQYDGAAPAMRILCAVAVLRAVGFVAPPLLDGLGFPERTLRYMIVAAIAMPASYIVAAITLGEALGFESVAVAWAIGYPIAFIVLIYMATHTLGWSLFKYIREVGGVVLCMMGAGAAAYGVRYLMGDAPGPVILGTTAATLLIVAGFLLAYTQNISLRTMMRSIKAKDLPPPQDMT